MREKYGTVADQRYGFSQDNAVERLRDPDDSFALKFHRSSAEMTEMSPTALTFCLKQDTEYVEFRTEGAGIPEFGTVETNGTWHRITAAPHGRDDDYLRVRISSQETLESPTIN